MTNIKARAKDTALGTAVACCCPSSKEEFSGGEKPAIKFSLIPGKFVSETLYSLCKYCIERVLIRTSCFPVHGAFFFLSHPVILYLSMSGKLSKFCLDYLK